jgi:hypothetical protein
VVCTAAWVGVQGGMACCVKPSFSLSAAKAAFLFPLDDGDMRMLAWEVGCVRMETKFKKIVTEL